jgi:hypothetical protein
MRTKDLEARQKLIVDIQRYAAEHQYAPNPSFDYGNRAAALWLDR